MLRMHLPVKSDDNSVSLVVSPAREWGKGACFSCAAIIRVSAEHRQRKHDPPQKLRGVFSFNRKDRRSSSLLGEFALDRYYRVNKNGDEATPFELTTISWCVPAPSVNPLDSMALSL